MAAALRLLLRQHAAAPPSPMLRSLFPAPYSKAAAAASLPAARGAPLSSPCLREVTPRKAPPPPKGEPPCCRTVPSTMTDSTKSLPDKLKDLKDSKKSLQDMEKNIEEHEEMISKALHDRKVANDLFSKRLDDRTKLLAKLSSVPDDYVETHNLRDVLTKINSMQDDLAKVEKMRVDYDKDWAIQEAKVPLFDEQMEMLRKKRQDYITAFRRYHELERFTMVQVENQEKVKKVAKVGAAVGIVGEPRYCETVPSTVTDSTKSLLDKLKDLKDTKKSLQDMERNIEEHTEMVRKGLEDRSVANDLFRKRLDDRQKLLDKLRNMQDDYSNIRNMQDDLAKVENMRVDYDKDWAIQEAKVRVFDEQMEMLRKKREDYITAFRRYHELERSTMEQVENQEKLKKVAKEVEPRCCKTVPSTMTDSTKSLLDKLKDLKDTKKSLQDMERNIEEHTEMVRKGLEDRSVANDLFTKRLDDRQKLLDKLRNMQDDYSNIRNMQDGLAKVSKMEDDYDKDQAIQRAKSLLFDEQIEVLREKHQDYLTALRRYHELERSTMEQVEKVKKVAKVGAAVGLVGGLLLILAKI